MIKTRFYIPIVHKVGFPQSSVSKETPALQRIWVSWRRKWQPIPIFLPGEFYGQRSLVGYSPWGHKESDTTEWLTHFKARWLHQWIVFNIRELMPILLKLQKIAEWGTLQIILWGHHHPDAKTRQRQHTKIKLQANIDDEYRCKNPQENSSKNNSTTH